MSNDRQSRLTGAEITEILRRCNVSKGRFFRDAGINESRGRRMLRGDQDGDIPKKVDPVLDGYMRRQRAADASPTQEDS